MTLNQIHAELTQAGKPVSAPTLHRYLRACKIRALTPLTKPRRYADDAGQKMVRWLGLGPTPNQRPTSGGLQLATLANLKATAKAARRITR